MGDVGETDKDQKTIKIPLLFDRFEAGQQIATRLIKKVHPDLVHVTIEFICRNIAKKKNKKPLPGAVYKVNPMFRFMTGYDFVVEVALEVWNIYDPQQREALIDHLLTRIHVEVDDAGDVKSSLRHPDVQEFTEVYSRHHAWNNELVEFENNAR